ncbi:MAG: helix-turn-helix transcriptional regulator [Myxococcales bacterium]|nr:helix-turn-helix transcriptional regulator [Myxococcales bacterium]
MTSRTEKPGLFPALLKFWRGRRGLSQLDLALTADVSARHVSFLETGRARPSEEMSLRLADALGLPLRERNELLRAAGFEAAFAEPPPGAGLDGVVGRALDRMMAQHEPFPMVLMDRLYNVLRLNRGAAAMLSRVVKNPAKSQNALHALFDPEGAREFIVDWKRAAYSILSRLHREVLEHPGDTQRAELLDALLAYPDVPRDFHKPDLDAPSEPVLTFQLRRGDLSLTFLTTVTRFSAPQNVTLDELCIESYFPLDDATEAACRALER